MTDIGTVFSQYYGYLFVEEEIFTLNSSGLNLFMPFSLIAGEHGLFSFTSTDLGLDNQVLFNIKVRWKAFEFMEIILFL